MSKQVFSGRSGQIEMGKILSENHYNSSSTRNSSLGFFQDIFRRDGKIYTAIIPNALNGGGVNFYGTIQEISEEEANRLLVS